MIHRSLLLCLSAFSGLLLVAQDLPPGVDITNVVLDEGAQTVTVTYTLTDPENDACTILFSASSDGGTTYLVNTANATGSLGAGIAPGTGLTITWNHGAFSPEGLTIRVLAEDGHTPDIQAMVDAVDPGRLMQRLAHVAIPRHHVAAPAGISAIRDTLVLAFGAAGLQSAQQNVTYQGSTVPNVIGRLPGLVDEARTYIVDGHYDAVSNTAGADDNATAVAATLEIARILAPYRFRNSLRFIGFSFEEQGLIGSQAYAQSGIPAWEQINGVLNMEMIGYYSDAPNSQQLPSGFDLLFPTATANIAADGYRGNFLTVVGNTASQPLIDAYVAACGAHVQELRIIPLAVPGNGQIAPDLRRSDHAVFWDTGRQALMLTDGSNFRNANYHTPNDVPATIDTAFYTNSVKATLAAAATLAQPINAGYDTYLLGDLVGQHEHHERFACTARTHVDRDRNMLVVRVGDCTADQVTATLFDLRGVRIAGKTLRPAAGDHDLPLAGLPNGLYVLVLQHGEQNRTVRVDVFR
jgi:hypothetical protein